MVTKYILIELDLNLKPFKIVSRHKTLDSAKKGIQRAKPARTSQGVTIFKML